MSTRALSHLVALALLAVPAPASAQWVEMIEERIRAVTSALADDGLVDLLAEPVIGRLEAGRAERTVIELPPGLQVRIVGICDDDCDDVDLTAFDGGAVLDRDVLEDATPIVDFTVPASGRLEIEVGMITCSSEPCFWGIMAYAERTAAPAAAAGAGSRAGPGDQYRGDLAKGDEQLTSGEFYDAYPVALTAGGRLEVEVSSGDFDTYLMIRSPSGESFENDDFEGDASRSRVELDAEESGEWNVYVTSYEPGETGGYRLTVATGVGAPGAMAAAGAGGAGGARRESGSLESGDRTLESGEYVDLFTFDARRGDELIVELRSSEFDPYLIVIGPDDEQTENDDWEGDASRSLVMETARADGEHRVLVTSYRPDETGRYDLTIRAGGAGSATAGTLLSERGTLAAGDETLRSGEYVDAFTFEGRPGQRVRVDVGSADFDTYVMLLGPGDFRRENDDVEDAPGHSVVEADLAEAGKYTVLVTSYAPDETGAYDLRVDGGRVAAATGQRDVHTLQLGRTAEGRLEEGDAQLESGEYRDLWVFDGAAGETVVVEMRSRGFDSYLGLLSPAGDVIDENDDADERTDLSRIEVTLRESGRYRVMATSFAAGESGDYALELRTGTAAVAAAAPTPAGGAGGQVYGIFAGISDYGGRANDLAYTAQDAVRFAEALQQGAGLRAENAILLTDAEATAPNLRAAFRQLAGRMGPDDTFVFFYSGHGARVPRQGGPERSDPDGMDETLELYDAAITDNEMNDLFGTLGSGLSVMVLDACFSGGFSKDVISEPGRIGFFSSEEDVTSQVAAKFRAGGYLAAFAADAVGGGYADADGDGAISAIELSQYLHERYRADVKSGAADDFVRTGGPQLGFQHLVVDRGSIRPYDIVFR